MGWTVEQRVRERASAEKAAKTRQNWLFFGNAFLFWGYVALALTLMSYNIFNSWAATALVLFSSAAHVLVAQRAWEG